MEGSVTAKRIEAPESGPENGVEQRGTVVEASFGRGLAVAGIGKSYGGRTVLRDVSLTVERGEVVGLLGPNGAGKTTCFYTIIGLIAPDYGRIELDGRDMTGLPMYRRAQLGVGYLPQEPSIFRGMTVADNIRAVLEVVEPDRQAREQRLDALLDEFSIAVDPVTTMRIVDVLKELRREMTIILVTNLTQQARRLADRTAFFLMGSCVEVGDTEALFTGEVDDKRTADYIAGRFG